MLIALIVLLYSLAGFALLCRYKSAENCGMPEIRRSGPIFPSGEHLAIPKIIWAYWHSQDRPPLVQRCLRNWESYNPDFRIEVLHAGNIKDFIPAGMLPGNFSQLTQQKQADWLRLALLHLHGGIWLDASIFLTKSLEWVLREQADSGAEYVGFYLEGFTTSLQHPVIENWCMAASPGSRFIHKWLEEFTGAIADGTGQAYLDRLKALGIYEKTLQKNNKPLYLLMHVTGQRIVQASDSYRLSVLKAEDSAFFYQFKSNWKRGGFRWRLLFLRHPRTAPALIKLRGGERDKFGKYLRWRLYTRNSLVGTQLMCRGL